MGNGPSILPENINFIEVFNSEKVNAMKDLNNSYETTSRVQPWTGCKGVHKCFGVVAKRGGFIFVHPNHPFTKFKDIEYSIPLDVHGGITYYNQNNEKFSSLNIPEDYWVIGWDYNHSRNSDEMNKGISYSNIKDTDSGSANKIESKVIPTFEIIKDEVIKACNYALIIDCEE